jgi:glyoxylase-like metal-dependent hydrolase (beta-lactamase superfamily II)
MQTLHQLFDHESCTFTYLLIDAASKEAVMIDPVDIHLSEYLALIKQQGLTLRYVLETHAHADHITSAGDLCKQTGAQAATPVHCNITPAEIQLVDGQALKFGAEQEILAIHTPGHTAGSMTFYWDHQLFTGDTLLINGCGRADFQSGDAKALHHSITEKLYRYSNDTVVYPGHDYQGKTSSTIGYEKANNPKVAGKSEAEFAATMEAQNLPKPKMIEVAVPANLKLGLTDIHAA